MRRARLLAACAPLIVMVLACCFPGASRSASDAATRAEESTLDQEPPSRDVVAEHYYAEFRDGLLAGCMEVREEYTPPPGALPRTDWPPDTTTPALDGLTIVPRACFEQFPGHRQLGACWTESAHRYDDGVVRTTYYRRLYYTVEDVLLSDRAMQACLQREGGGRWEPSVAADSTLGQQLIREHRLRRLTGRR